METNDLTKQIGASLIGTFGVEKLKTGLPSLDKVIGGLRPANTYQVAGLEKSGKSAFVMGLVLEWLKAGKHITFVDTELNAADFFTRLSAIDSWRPSRQVEAELDKAIFARKKEESQVFKFASKYDSQLTRVGLESITEGGSLSVEKTFNLLEEKCTNKHILIFDNVTSFFSSQVEKSWEVLGNVLLRLVNFSKAKNLVTLAVVHTKPGEVVWTETPGGIRSIVKEDKPQDIFKESVIVNRRPSITNVYGGGAARSQLSGSFLVWRPYQSFSSLDLQKLGAILFDGSRHSGFGEVRAEFWPEIPAWTEAPMSDDDAIINSIQEGYEQN